MVLLGLICLWIGFQTKIKKANHDAYLLANRNLGLFSLSLSLLATQLGGGVILGSAEAAYGLGAAAFFYPLGLVFGFIMLALLVSKKFRALEVNTLAEIFEQCYGSKTLRKFAAFVSMSSLFLILIAMGIAAKKFFISIGVTNPVIYPAIWLILMFYTIKGGLLSVVWTDIVQVVFIIVAFVLVTFVGWQPLASIDWATQVASTQNASISWNSWVLMPMIYLLCEQTMAQRCVAAQSTKAYSLAAMIAAAMLFVLSLVPTAFGILSQNFSADIPANASRLMFCVENLTNPTVTAIFSCAIFMAIFSTADSLMSSLMVNLGYDFLEQRQWSDKAKLRVTQAITLVLGLLALTISYLMDNVMNALILSYEFSVCCLSVPILAALFKNKNSLQAALYSVGLGTFGFVYFKFSTITLSFPKELLILLLSTLGYGLGNLKINKTQRIARCTN